MTPSGPPCLQARSIIGTHWPLRLIMALIVVAQVLPAQAAAAPLAQQLERAAHALDAWQLEAAMDIATDVLMQHPHSDDARVLAAEVMHQRGQHEEALALLGEGRLAAPDADRILGRAASLHGPERLGQFVPQLRGSAAYAATFVTRPTRHFRIRYQDKDLLMAHYAEEVLEAAYSRIGEALDAKVSEGTEPITVEIYPDVKGLAAATGLTEQEIETSGTIAVCKFHRLMVISALATRAGYAWADTMAHELTHLMISKRSHNHVPIWLHEGIAKYFESTWRGPPGQNLSAHSEHLLGKAVKEKALIPFARMHPSMAKLPNQHDAALAFAEVFSMVHMLVAEKGPNVVARALRELGTGMDFDTMLKKTFGAPLPVLEKSLHRRLEKTRFKEVYGEANTLKLGQQKKFDSNDEDLAADLPEQADAEAKKLLRLGELLALRGHHEAALDPLGRAYLRVGARLPKLGLRLAQALTDAERYDDAMQVAKTTVQTYPEVTDAQLLYATLLLKKDQTQEAIGPLKFYCLHNPYNPHVHHLLAQAYQLLHQDKNMHVEQNFARLADAPRVAAACPKPPLGDAKLRIITSPWTEAFLDDDPEALRSPTWDRPVPHGQHTVDITWASPCGNKNRQEKFEARVGQVTTLQRSLPLDLCAH